MSLERFRIKQVIFLLLVLLIHAAGSFAQSSNKNYVQTKTFLDDAGSTFLRHIDYDDELKDRRDGSDEHFFNGEF